MSVSFNQGNLQIKNSITYDGINDRNSIDSDSPLSLLEFCKLFNSSDDSNIGTYYEDYLKQWNRISGNKSSDEKNLIVDQYKTFLKEIVLNYSNREEKKFLSNIDYNDPQDLDIIVGFFSKKLNEIARSYKNDRHNIKYSLSKYKLAGSVAGLSKSLTELIINYLENYENGYYYYDIEDIKQKLEVEIVDLYDYYTDYYNQTPDALIYDKKDLDYGLDIFLKSNTTLITELFSDISDQLKGWKELSDLFDNKRKLTQNSVYCDFYYLSTGSTVYDIVSGKLFESTSGISNFLNRDYPTTQSTQNLDYLKNTYEVGFFKPDKKSLILVDGKTSAFTYNLSSLSPNSIYYFPDPLQTSSKTNIVVYKFDVEYLKNNYTSGVGINRPKNLNNSVNYFGYGSGISPNQGIFLDNIYNSGYIKNSFFDIYGNCYGLFDNRGDFRKNVEILNQETQYYVNFDGYKFFDDFYNEGYSFNYSTSDYTTYKETVRSGLSCLSSSFLGSPHDVILDFGDFSNFKFKSPTEAHLIPKYSIYEGGFFTKLDNTLYLDTVSTDLLEFDDNNGSHYFNTLLDGGIRSISPTERGLFDPTYPTLSSNLLYNPKNDLLILDGGIIGHDELDKFVLDGNDYYNLSSGTSNPTTYSNLSEYENYYNGKLIIKNNITGESGELLDMLSYMNYKYSSPILLELENDIESINLTHDILYIKTKSYFVIEKIDFSDGVYQNPRTETYTTTLSTHTRKISNIVKDKNLVYYCVDVLDDINGNKVHYPEIYQFNSDHFKNDKLFPTSNDDVVALSALFYRDSGIEYDSINVPHLKYSKEKNIFTVSNVLKDQNNYPEIHSLDFYISGGSVEFGNKNSYISDVYRYSNDLSVNSNMTIFMNSGYTTNGKELII